MGILVTANFEGERSAVFIRVSTADNRGDQISHGNNSNSAYYEQDEIG
jgi:hypothetical protein